MTIRPDRRTFCLTSAAAIGAAAAAPLRALAPTETPVDRIMRRAVVINGNMLPPFSEDPANDMAFAADLSATGLTAVKYSLAGAAGDFGTAIDHIGAIANAIADHADRYLLVRTVADIADAKRTGRIGIIFAFEAATMFDGSVERISYFGDLGVRSMQLSYNGRSPFAAGVMVDDPEAGLTELGRRAVTTMNAAGIAIDASHSNDRSTFDIIGQSSRPVMISHGGCAAIHPHLRNRSDAALRAIADNGGVFGLYELAYLTPGMEQQTLADYMRHLVHAIDICGVDHVGIGSDSLMLEFDTGPDSIADWNRSIEARRAAGVNAPGEGPPPFVEGLNGPHRMRTIAAELLARGHGEAAIEKILGGNFFRLFAETWR
ncbi:MAG: dipeptidase [Parasphingopyxis sp.]|uniref:dipeptidase n=1 Tax=Parasphingopyxis sp. TaxID=1920299 RepID=UPI003FA181E8